MKVHLINKAAFFFESEIFVVGSSRDPRLRRILRDFPLLELELDQALTMNTHSLSLQFLFENTVLLLFFLIFSFFYL